MHKKKLYTIVLVLWLFSQICFSQTTVKTPIPQSLINEMAKREKRYHHYLWHNVRDGWYRFSDATKKQLTDLGWAPPRPARGLDANGNVIAVTDNNSGEDFLYMHRQMIKQANDIIALTNPSHGKIVGWTKIPAPGDRDFPVPADYTVPGSPSTTSSIRTRKTVSYYNNNIKPMEDLLTNPEELKKMTLGQLGSRIETTVHNWMHLRFSSESTYGYRPGSSAAVPNFSTKWDNVRYDWLGDSYSSHVSPVFWRLHSWVNDRVDQWARANNLTTIRWKGFWTGGPMSSISGMTGILSGKSNPMTMGSAHNSLKGAKGSSAVGDVAQEVMGIILREKESTFADDVKIDIPLPQPKKKSLSSSSKKKSR